MLHTIEGADCFGTRAASKVFFFSTPKFFWVPNISLSMQMTMMAACHTLKVKLRHQLSCFFGTNCCSVTKNMKKYEKIHSRFSTFRSGRRKTFWISRFVPNKKGFGLHIVWKPRGGGVATSVLEDCLCDVLLGKSIRATRSRLDVCWCPTFTWQTPTWMGFGTLRSLGFRIFLQSYRNRYS